MNHTYRLIWNDIANTWVPVAEYASARGKRSRDRAGAARRARIGGGIRPWVGGMLCAGLIVSSAFAAPASGELPSGGSVAAGQASISSAGNAMTISQASNKAILNWNSFNIGEQASVTFNQPNSSAVALNRVNSANPSQIYGSLSANGQVFLVNTAGVYFGPNSRVDVGGLVASTQNISDRNFLDGNYTFEAPMVQAEGVSIDNQGKIRTADGGYIAFIAPQISNSGSLEANGGMVAMAAGNKVSLDFSGDSLINFSIDEGAINAEVNNGGVIRAHDGTVKLSAQAADELTKAVVNNSGIIEANSIAQQGGRILIGGGAGTQTTISGKLDASSQSAKGGHVEITGEQIELTETSQIDATGATGGGNVLVGGDWQGGASEQHQVYDDPDAVYEATQVTLRAGATIDASALENGNGGTVVLWSDTHNPDSITSAHGSITARGGAQGGNGGKIETSGRVLQVDGIKVSTRAAQGAAGIWLLDPEDITISAGSVGGNTTTINPDTINSSLEDTNVIVQTAGGISVDAGIATTQTATGALTLDATAGSVEVKSDISLGTGRLTLKATQDVVIHDNKTITTQGGDIVLWANSDNINNGYIGTGYQVTLQTNGGAIYMGGGSDDGNTGALSSAVALDGLPDMPTAGYGGPAFGIHLGNGGIGTAFSIKLLSGGGDITLLGGIAGDYSSGQNAHGIGIVPGYTIDAGSGNITMKGYANSAGGNSYGLDLMTGGQNVSSSIASTGNVTLYGETTANSAESWGVAMGGGGALAIGATSIDIAANGADRDLHLDAQLTATDTITLTGSASSPQGIVGTANSAIAAPNLLVKDATNVNLSAGTNNVDTLAITGVGTFTYIDQDDLTIGSVNGVDGITYSGGYTMTIQADAISGSGNINFGANGGSLVLNATSGSGTYSGVISGSGSLTKSGAGSLLLTGNNTYTGNYIGATFINGGTLQIGDGSSNATSGTVGAGNIVVESGANLTYARSDDLTMSQIISGAGSLIKNNTGALTLLGQNTFSGGITVNGGNLIAGVSNTFSYGNGVPYDIVVNDGGTLTFGATGVLGSYATSHSHTLIINSGGVVTNSGNFFSMLGAVVLNGGTLTSVGGGEHYNGSGVANAWAVGTWTGSGSNTNNVTVTADSTITGVGHVALGQYGYGGAFNVATDATLRIDAVLTRAIEQNSDPATLAGRLIKQGAGTLVLTGNNTYDRITQINDGSLQIGDGSSNATSGTVGAGNIVVQSGANLTYARSDDLTMSQVISGGGSLIKDNTGTLVLTQNNTYTGGTTINDGVLVLRHDAPNPTVKTFDGSGALRIEPSSTSFTSPFSTSGWTYNSTLSGLTLGKDGNTANITMASDQTVSGPVTIYGGAIAINGALTATSSNINLHATGAVTQTAAMTADSLNLSGAGSFTLTNTGNTIGTLAGGDGANKLGSLSFVNSGALIIGTVDSTGISASGDLSISTLTGDLTVADDVTTDSISASAITLNAGSGESSGTATGGDILLSANVATGTNGRIRLFTGSIAGSTGITDAVGFGSGNFRYNADETTNFSTGSWTNIGNSGTYAIYREQPTANITDDMMLSMTYGDTLPEISGTGMVNGDGSLYDITGRADSASGNIQASGTPYAITSNLAGLGYNVTGTSSGTLTVNTKALNISGLLASNKTYDGLLTASLTGTETLSSGGVSSSDGLYITGDTVSLSGSATGEFADKNVGANIAVTVAGLSFTGADAVNYVINPYTLGADITAKTVTLSASKTYDGTTDLSGYVTLNGLVGSETLVYSGATASSKHVTTSGKYINAINLGDGANGGLASNYQLPDLTAYSAGVNSVTINAATLTSTLTNTGVTKVYDGTTNAPGAFAPTWSFTGLVGGDTDAGLNFTAASYNDANVLAANTLAVSGLNIGSVIGSNGSLASDYVLDSTSKSIAATISKATLTVQADNDAKFVTQSDTVNFAGVSYSGFVNGETTAVLGGTATVTRSNAGTETAGIYSSVLQASGLTADNYAFNYVNGDFTIVPSSQLLVRATDVSNTYGTTTSYGITSASYWDGSQEVVLGAPTNIGNNTFDVNDGAGGSAVFTLAPSNSNISGAGFLKTGSYQLDITGTVTENSGNFSDTITVVGSHQVNSKALSASATAGISKIYDGTTAMNGVSLTLAGKEVNDIVTVAGLGAFDSKNAGSNLGYTINNLALSGDDASNYYLSGGGSFSGNDGEIFKKTVSLDPQSVNRDYNGSASYTPTAADLDYLTNLLGVSGDSVTSATLNFDDKNVGNGKTLTLIAALIDDGNGGNNYAISLGSNDSSEITRLDSVTWVGGATGNWFDPANWAGGAVPDLANVANVVIPSGVIIDFNNTVVPPAEAGAVNIDSIGTNGGLNVSAGALNVANDLQLANYTQSGGDVSTGGDFTITNSFDQTGGSIAVAGNVGINQTSGNTNLGDISAGGTLDVTAGGDITQQPGSTITVTGESTLASTNGDITLDSATNDFSVVNASGGNITLADANSIGLGDIDASGQLTVTAADDITLDGAIEVASLDLTATNGDITQNGGTLTVTTGPTDLSASGDITLDQANDFSGAVNVANAQNVTLNDINSIELGDIDASGLLTVTAVDDITLDGTIGVASLDLTATGGDITQNGGTLTVTTGPTDLSAGGDITLDQANDFNGAVNVANAQNVTLNDINSIELGDIDASGLLTVTAADDITLDGTIEVASLDLTATGGDITQNGGTLTVTTGPTDLSAGGDITLDQANDFNGAVNAYGGNITLTDINDIVFGDITASGTLNATATGDINQAAGTLIDVDGTARFESTDGTVFVAAGGNQIDGGLTIVDTRDSTDPTDLNERTSGLGTPDDPTPVPAPETSAHMPLAPESPEPSPSPVTVVQFESEGNGAPSLYTGEASSSPSADGLRTGDVPNVEVVLGEPVVEIGSSGAVQFRTNGTVDLVTRNGMRVSGIGLIGAQIVTRDNGVVISRERPEGSGGKAGNTTRVSVVFFDPDGLQNVGDFVVVDGQEELSVMPTGERYRSRIEANPEAITGEIRFDTQDSLQQAIGYRVGYNQAGLVVIRPESALGREMMELRPDLVVALALVELQRQTDAVIETVEIIVFR